MGFKKTQFHKVGYDADTYESMMVPDIEQDKFETVNGKSVRVKVPKVHPKSDSFWMLRYSENYILWSLVKNHQIDKIWLENKSIKNKSRNIWNRSKDINIMLNGDERVKLIFDLSSRESFPLGGKNQIMNLFPKEVRRDFLLEQLFGI